MLQDFFFKTHVCGKACKYLLCLKVRVWCVLRGLCHSENALESDHETKRGPHVT